MKVIDQLKICAILLLCINAFKFRKDPLPDAFDYLSNIDPSIIQSVRYASTNNFVGKVI